MSKVLDRQLAVDAIGRFLSGDFGWGDQSCKDVAPFYFHAGALPNEKMVVQRTIFSVELDATEEHLPRQIRSRRVAFLVVEFVGRYLRIVPRMIKGKYVDAGLQLLEDLGITHSMISHLSQLSLVPDGKLWRIQPSTDYDGLRLVPKPVFRMIRDLFEDAGIRTSVNNRTIPFHEVFTDDEEAEVRIPFAVEMLFGHYLASDLERFLIQFADAYSGVRPFRVPDPRWSSADHEDGPLTREWKEWSRARHALCGGLQSAGAAEGGFEMPWCLGRRLLELVRRLDDPRCDCRGTRRYHGRHGVPFWTMIAFRESLHTFGIRTELLTHQCKGWWWDDQPTIAARAETFVADSGSCSIF